MERDDEAALEQFKAIVDSVRDYAIFMLDPQGVVQSWNVGAQAIKGRSSASMPAADFDKEQKELEEKVGHKIDHDDLLSYLLYPEVFLKYDKFKQDYSDVSVLPTPPFFFGLKSGEEITVDIEAGKTLIIKFLTASDPHPDGTRTPPLKMASTLPSASSVS